MPWRREATKDVASCDKPRGAASRHRSGDVRMGEPGWGNAHSSVAKSIGHGTRTGGTETSQYLEGKESNRDSPSSGERKGSSLKPDPSNRFWGCGALTGETRRVTKSGDSRRLWKVPP